MTLFQSLHTKLKLSACSMYVFAILELCEVDQHDNLVNLADGKQCTKNITLCLDFRLSANEQSNL